MTEHSRAPVSTGFNCVIVGSNVQCSDPEARSHTTISTENIVCVLPSNGEHAYDSTMLFLRNDVGSQDSTLELERIYLRTTPPALLSSQSLTELPNHLCHPSNRRIELHIIISTASGTGTAGLLFSRILQRLLLYLGLNQYQVHETQSAQTITELCHSWFIPQAEAGVQQTIVLLSGDGGLCDIIDSFYKTTKEIRAMPNIALIPAGTGNAMANSTGLSGHPKTALMALLRGNPSPVPVFAATFSHGASNVQDGQIRSPATGDAPCLKIYGGVVASWGVHAALVADSDTAEYRKFGAERFKMAAEELLFPSDGNETHRYNGTITLIKRDDEQENEHREVLGHKYHMYVLATLVSNLEKDFMISPQSTLLDGCLRMIRFGPMPPQRAMQVLSSAYQKGQHVQDDDVMYSEIEGFRIDFHEADERWRRACIDGRVVVVEEGGWMEVQKEKRRLLNILVPEV
ncbi:ATP-NAD kinase-like domain-containing protein [Aspergillus cavernicola]|uniref:ATP-NAD kinase-like domain-containing protein n=1 Tax=Aspergillus cavernicola TaxID=176166 RepID=A0ABR4HL37_9EURO